MRGHLCISGLPLESPMCSFTLPDIYIRTPDRRGKAITNERTRIFITLGFNYRHF